ncbi:MAG: 30S ribosome-binding factor RbfA [Desulfobacterales bacterium]|jgi:ribosome-binding factor A|nr:30S ribosome-binding factor RbfA [Desulfobacterales bacterium]
MSPFSRADRVGGLIQKVLSNILNKNIRDPRLKMVTITGVKVSRDLKQARIYFTTSGGIQKKDDTTEGFNSAHGFIKRTLAHELDLRYMPHLKFFYDESLEYGAHIDELIESTKSKNGSNHSTY